MVRSVLLAVFLAFLFAITACSSSENSGLSPQENQGQSLFAIHCASCHSSSGGTAIVGPSLDGISTAAGGRVEGLDAGAYLTQSIVDPSAYLIEGFPDLMPRTFGQVLTSADLDALVSFLLTLK